MTTVHQIGIIGATGAVGRELLRLLAKRNVPAQCVRCFASQKSEGQTLPFSDTYLPVETVRDSLFQSLDLAFFCAGSSFSLEWAFLARDQGCFVIDCSSALRMHPTIPLAIPEVNLSAMQNHSGIISSPNCVATLLLLALAPLHKALQATRALVTTYQAASGGGAKLMERLQEETKAFFNQIPLPKDFPYPYAFNLYPHDSPLQENGYVEEEIKIMQEVRKVLQEPSFHIHATCIRVPVLRAHSLSINISFAKEVSLADVSRILEEAKGIALVEDRAKNRFPTPYDATEHEKVLCGRFRLDQSQRNTLDFWMVGDQLLKGAALNAVQIAESLFSLPDSSSQTNGATDLNCNTSFVTGCRKESSLQ